MTIQAVAENNLQGLSVLVIGAGQRGYAYSRAIHSKQLSSRCFVAAVAEPDSDKRTHFANTFGIPSDAVFSDWRDVVRSADQGERLTVDGVLICTLDWQHEEPATSFARLGYHVMLEKPLSTTFSSTRKILEAFKSSNRLFSVGHVLRYSPFYLLMKRLISEEDKIGQIRQIEHTERVGWWHFAHSYVRGNWRNSGLDKNGKETGLGAPSLLAKCCHDTDLLFWFLDERPMTEVQSTTSGSDAEAQEVQYWNANLEKQAVRSDLTAGKGLKSSNTPLTVYSSGSLSQFTKANKPEGAGTHCLTCPIEERCMYSAKRIYIDHALKNPVRGTSWPASVLVPDIEDYPTSEREQAILTAISPERSKEEGWNYGRCVWDIPDNDVCENQSVLYTFPSGVLATLNMVATAGPASKRLINLYGTHGEMHADGHMKTVTVHTYADDASRTYRPDTNQSPGSHGGGDFGLAKAFVDAMWRVEREGQAVDEAQLELLGFDCSDLEKAYNGVWAAEKSRKLGRAVSWGEPLD